MQIFTPKQNRLTNITDQLRYEVARSADLFLFSLKMLQVTNRALITGNMSELKLQCGNWVYMKPQTGASLSYFLSQSASLLLGVKKKKKLLDSMLPT